MDGLELFEKRKRDHISMALDQRSQAINSQFDSIILQHQPLPDIDFSEIRTGCEVFGFPLKSPLFVSSMTLGHGGANAINIRIAKACREKGWMMGVGSQRRQLFDKEAYGECENLRREFPNLVLFGNIGLSQVISSELSEIQHLVDSLQANFMVVHTNPLQEVLQAEGTPHFKGGFEALEKLAQTLNVPVVLKETGCGFSRTALKKFLKSNLAAIDVAGVGGTHWGRVEGLRQASDSLNYKAAETFAHWGHSTVESLLGAVGLGLSQKVWASGGVRSGLDAAKLLVLGAEKVGLAQPILSAALKGEQSLLRVMDQFDFELRVAMFCLGCANLEAIIGEDELWKKK